MTGVAAMARPGTRPVLAVLVVLGCVMVVVRALAPDTSRTVGPALLTVAAALAALTLTRAARELPGRAGHPWRALAVACTLIATTQLLTVLHGSGRDESEGGWYDVPQLLAVPVAVAGCLMLMEPRTIRRFRSRVLLDGAIVLVAVTVFGEFVLADLIPGTVSPGQGLLTVGYPAVGAFLCGLGFMTLARVRPARRRTGAWVLAACIAMATVAITGALGRVAGSVLWGTVTMAAWDALLVFVVLAAAVDPGRAGERRERTAALPWFGLALGQGAAFAVMLLLVTGLLGGRPMTRFETVAVAVLVPLVFLRNLLWAIDGQGLTRRLQQAEAYFRTLVDSADDVTVVLDRDGTVGWISGDVTAQLGWPEPELAGQRFAHLLHSDDGDLAGRLEARADADDDAGHPVTARLRSQAGEWRDVEVSGVTRIRPPGSQRGDGLVLRLRDVTARRSSQLELERMAWTDYLTGLPNRARFMAELDQARTRTSDGAPSCVLLIDLDGFKTVNDVAGHEAGDRLLQEVAAALTDASRDGDLVARLGGDEFVLLVPGTVAEVHLLAERLVRVLDRPFRAPGRGGDGGGPLFGLSGSIGLAEVRADEDAATAVRRADLALRAAKTAGKNCVRTSAPDLDDAMGRRDRLSRDLPAALEEGQLRLLYQPVVGVQQRRVVGLEALVRWEHPALGTVPPDEFIGLAEDDGLIVPLQRWVMDRAAADLAVLTGEGYDLNVAVNISVRHLQAGCLSPDVAHALAASGAPPGKFVLEITESVMLDAEAHLESDLGTLRGMGCTIALDDFGRGWSSLAYLARLPVDILKMDREFVAGIGDDPKVRALVGGVVELSRTLGMDVVAEGVETAEQAAILQDLRCTFLQGWLLGRPVPFDQLRSVIDGFDPTVVDIGLPASAGLAG